MTGRFVDPEFRILMDRLLLDDREIRRLKARMDEFAMGSEVRADAIGGVLPPEHGGTGITGSVLGGVSMWLNNTGGVVNQGTVVISDGDRLFDVTTTQADRRTIGICDDNAVAAGANARIRHTGYQSVVLVQGAVAAGDFLWASTTSGRASSAGGDASFGVFGMALTAFVGPGAGTVSAFIFPIMDGGSGAAGSGGFITVKEDGTTVLSAATSLDFLEPDTTFITPTANEANFNMALYALLSGRAGGQVLTGGLAAAEVLRLLSTAHATKGQVQMGTQGGALGFKYEETDDRAAIGGGSIVHTVSGVQAEWKMEAHSEGEAHPSGFLVHRHAESASIYGNFSMMRSRGVHAGPSAVLSDDEIGRVDALAYDGSDYEPVGALVFSADGSPGPRVPGRMSFYTTPDGGAAPVERVRIDKAGVMSFVGALMRLPATTKTVSGGVITIGTGNTSNFVITGPASVDGIAGGQDGMVLLLSAGNDTDTVTLNNNTGAAGQKFFTQGGTAITFDDISDFALAFYKSSLDGGNGGWAVGLIGGGSASGGHTIQDEGISLLARSFLNFQGPTGLAPRNWGLLQAIDNPGSLRTDVHAGYKEFDAIVDANQYSAAAWNVPVYSRLVDAINAGHRSIRFITSNDVSAITISAADAVQNIQGDTHPSGVAFGASIPVNLTVNKSGVILDNLSFDNVALTYGALSVVSVGCRFTGSATVTMSSDNGAMVACSGVALSAGTAITLTGASCRVQACTFSLCSTTAAIIGGAMPNGGIIGNIFYGNAETGYFINASSNVRSSINGNIFSQPLSATGSIRSGIATNISGNLFATATITGGVTRFVIDNVGRSLVTGNIFDVSQGVGIGNTLTIVQGRAGLPGFTVANNVFISGSAGGNIYGAENTAGGLVNQGNSYIGVGSSNNNSYAVNALNQDYLNFGNLYSSGSAVGLQTWQPVTNSSGGSALSSSSVNKLNSSGFVDIVTGRFEILEDFINTFAATMWAPSETDIPPLGWDVTLTNGAALTYPQDVRGGIARLTTGAATNSGAVLYLDSNVLSPSNAGSFQAALASLSLVTSIRLRVGFMRRADWAALIAAPTISGYSDYFILEFDTSSGVSVTNWILRSRLASGAERTIDSLVDQVAAGAGTPTKLTAMVSNVIEILVNGRPRINTAGGITQVPSVLMTPGIFLQTLNGTAKSIDLDMIQCAGARV